VSVPGETTTGVSTAGMVGAPAGGTVRVVIRPSFLLVRRYQPEVHPGLTDLDEVAIRVAEEGADLAAPIDGSRQELGSAATERVVGGLAVRDANRELVVDELGIGWRREGDIGLVLRGLSAGHRQDPGARETEDRR